MKKFTATINNNNFNYFIMITHIVRGKKENYSKFILKIKYGL